jgi:hypothetical protein
MMGMKKRLFSLLFLLGTISQVAFSQIGDYRSEFAVGVNGGYVLSNVGFMPEVPQTMHKGFTGGLSMRYTCEKYFSSICAIVAELNYAQVGWKEEILTPNDDPVINATTGQPERYERDITYIQVPVFARMGWGRERKGFQVFFQAGPQVGFLLSEKTHMNFPWDSRTPVYSDGSGRTSSIVAQDTMAVERKVDYGIAAGLGLEFSHRKLGHFLMEGRYYYGLGDIYGNSKKDYFGRSNLGNIVIKMTYLFDIVKSNNSKIK